MYKWFWGITEKIVIKMKVIRMVVVLFFCCLAVSGQLFGMEAASSNQQERKIVEEKNGKLTFEKARVLCKKKKADTLRKYEEMKREIISGDKK